MPESSTAASDSLSNASPTTRPVTSKSRGICRYYNTKYGCFSGDRCKFLHGATERLTPFDKSKVCRYYATGYCKNGDKCWFIHADPKAPPEEDSDLCSICYDKPTTYGLLANCSHIFCIGCIKNWRRADGKSVDIVDAGTTKTCPMCRTASKFITPSSIFYADEDPQKASVIENYKASMKRMTCKYFEKSKPGRRFCPFGDDCFYKHEESEGVPYMFKYGADEQTERRRRRQEHNIRSFGFNSFGIPGGGDTFEAILNQITSLIDNVRMTPHEVEQVVFSSVMSMLSSDASPASHEELSEDETVTPSLEDQPDEEPQIMWPEWTIDEVIGSLPDPNDVEVLPALPPSSPRIPGPPSEIHSFTLDDNSPVFVPSFLDNLRPIPSGPPIAIDHEGGAVADSPLDPSLPWGLASVSASLPPTSSETIGVVSTAERELAAIPDSDPPFMTDGRGRVVWSSTSPARSRDGRRARATSSSGVVPAHPKPNVDLSAMDESSDEVSQNDCLGTRPASVSRRLVRQRSLPLVGTSSDAAACAPEFVTDGRGRVVFALGNHP